MNVNPFESSVAPLLTKKDGQATMGLQRLWEQPEVLKELEPKKIPVKVMVPKTFKGLLLKYAKK